MTPNSLAWIALYGWPAVVLAVFAMRRPSNRLARTTAWLMILPVMFLPANLDLPFAALNKHRIATLSIAAALALFHRRELLVRDRWRHLPLIALAIFTIGSLATVRTNADPISYGILRLPAMEPRDAAWLTYAFAVDLFLPFAIGQRVFRTERDLRDLLAVLSTCALAYVPLCLIEMRLSPQLSNWVYGYFPHSFLQTLRGSGYRPVVFMNHGLSVAMFLFSGFCAALALLLVRAPARPSPGARALVVFAILVISRNLAATLYALMAFVLIRWTPSRARVWTVVAIATIVITYPTLRAYDLVPTTEISDAFRGINPERSDSLQFRFDEEDKLLKRAMRRPLFGWGNWARNRIFISWGERGDEWAGYKDVSITDGSWIIWLGASGFVGFSTSFALILIPLFRLARHRLRQQASMQALLGALAVTAVFFAVDLIPNAASDPLPFTYAGALFTLAAARSRGWGEERTRAQPEPPLERAHPGTSG